MSSEHESQLTPGSSTRWALDTSLSQEENSLQIHALLYSLADLETQDTQQPYLFVPALP